MDSATIGLWAVLSAPACASYAVAQANRAPIAAPPVGACGVLACAALAALAVGAAPDARGALAALALMSMLAYLAAFDLRALAAPVWPMLAFIALGLGEGLAADVFVERTVAACLGAGAFLGLDLAYRLVRGRSGLGAGDALAAALIGAWLSLEGLVWSVALGGAVGVGWALLNRRGAQDPMPFIPALALGAAATLIVRGVVS